MLDLDLREWLETDGMGGFASGTVSGPRTRRYHGLLTTATTPPTGRFLLVNGLEAWVESKDGSFQISTQRYSPDVVYPKGFERLESFSIDPWPTWVFLLEDGRRITQEVFMAHGVSIVCVVFSVEDRRRGGTLVVRPLLTGRNPHQLHHENGDFRFEAAAAPGRWVWRPYDNVPAVILAANGAYTEAPEWYRNFHYAEEKARGFDHEEDAASPGSLRFDLGRGPAVLLFGAEGFHGGKLGEGVDAAALAIALRKAEMKRRAALGEGLARAADHYIVKRGRGSTIVAGYPWFTDWGRDTFIAMRGLCLATGRLEEAESILLEWSGAVSGGMLPNRFTEEKDTAEFNAVDAALWFIVAVHDFRAACARQHRRISKERQQALDAAIAAILAGYRDGTRHGIRMSGDALLEAGEPGVQLTWMDAKVGDWVVTPRIGKPVEIQALWINALEIGAALDASFGALAQTARRSFGERFWNETTQALNDVVDDQHRLGEVDAQIRPNQIFAVGGLPRAILEGARAKAVVAAVEAKLLTPAGLRTLAPDAPAYAPRYEGGPTARDGAYHQGTVWPWLMGAFVEAWVRVHGDTDKARAEARKRFLAPLLKQTETLGLGHLSEIADGDPPHRRRGCPFQAWSVGEALRLELQVLEARGAATKKPPARQTATPKKKR